MTNSKFHHAVKREAMGLLFWGCVVAIGLPIAILLWFGIAALGGL